VQSSNSPAVIFFTIKFYNQNYIKALPENIIRRPTFTFYALHIRAAPIEWHRSSSKMLMYLTLDDLFEIGMTTTV
jgi:hypothetical protein